MSNDMTTKGRFNVCKHQTRSACYQLDTDIPSVSNLSIHRPPSSNVDLSDQCNAWRNGMLEMIRLWLEMNGGYIVALTGVQSSWMMTRLMQPP